MKNNMNAGLVQVAVVTLSLVMIVPILGQSAQAPTFEVASLKKGEENLRIWTITGGPGTKDPGRFTATAPLRAILLQAYELRPDQLSGPDTLDYDMFDIVAKIPEGSTKSQVNLMLRNLLAERIGLHVHTESRELPTYELTVAKNGLKLKKAAETPANSSTPAPAAPGPPAISMGPDGLPDLAPGKPMWIELPAAPNVRLIARMQTIADIVKILERKLSHPVIDHTGLTGSYDYKLFFSPNQPQTTSVPADESVRIGIASDPVPDLVAAVALQLGLKLEMKKVPSEIVVVDRYDKTPVSN